MVLVVGATGSVGSEVCQKLARAGEKVRALVRRTSSKEKIEILKACGVELCVGDLKDAGSITTACPRRGSGDLDGVLNLVPAGRRLD